jgi:hypothetical protein
MHPTVQIQLYFKVFFREDGTDEHFFKYFKLLQGVKFISQESLKIR